VIEVTARKYAAPWTDEDDSIWWRFVFRNRRLAALREIPVRGDKEDADLIFFLVSANSSERPAFGPT
jgi:hypothetical protein